MKNFLLTVLAICVAVLIAGCGPERANSTAGKDGPAGADRAPGELPDAAAPGADSGDSRTRTLPPGTDEGAGTDDAELTSDAAGPAGDVVPRRRDGEAAEKDIRQWVANLSDSRKEIRERASDLLDTLGADKTRQLITLMKDESVAVRRGAAFGLLPMFDTGNSDVDEALFAALSDEDRTVRHIGLQAVNELAGQAVLPVIGRLAEMLDATKEDKHIRSQIARRLGRLGPSAAEALPALLSAGREDQDRDVRAACLYAVRKIAEPDQAVTVFRTVLRDDPDNKLRAAAASRIGSYGPAAADAISDLVAALDQDKDSTVRDRAVEALARIGEKALPALVERLDVKDREVRIRSIYALGKMGPAAKPVADRLKKLLSDDDKDVRFAAEVSLKRLEGG